MKRMFGLLIGLALLGWTAPPRPRAPTASVKSVKAVAGQLQIIAAFRAGSNTTSLIDSASYAGASVGHVLPATATVDTLLLPLPTSSITGSFSLRGRNAVGTSAPVVLSWTYTAPAPVVTIPPPPTAVTLAARVNNGQLWLVTTWAAAPGATSYVDTLNLNVSPWTMLGGHTILVATPDSFVVPMPTVATAYFVCVRSVNSAGSSGTACNSTSYSPPAPPGTPIVDSIWIRSVSFTTRAPTGQITTFLASGSMIPGTNTGMRLFCAFCFTSDGGVHPGAIPGTVQDAAKRVASCDSLGRALFNVRYSVRTPTKLEREQVLTALQFGRWRRQH